ncbi:MAG: YihY/virulence factor BrkB family protein [Caldilineaceae bacterium]|nr:YihY/virulence factor BrkB family protein [Caldilineaceae bacterium]
MKRGWTLLKATFKEFGRDKATRLAAALSYYTAISIAPMLIFLLLILGFLVGGSAAESQLISQIRIAVGPDASEFITGIIENAQEPAAGGIAGILSLIVLIWGSTNVLSHLQETLNVVWNVKARSDLGILKTIRRRLFAFGLVVGIGLLLFASVLFSSVLAVVANLFTDLLPGGALLWQVVEFVISLLIVTLLFAVLFKMLPDAETKWSDIWPGAALTAVLFTVGRIALTIYMGQAAPGSAYGAAGSVIIFLLWVYYSSLILFFGAEFTQVYANRYGAGIEPSDDAVYADQPIPGD